MNAKSLLLGCVLLTPFGTCLATEPSVLLRAQRADISNGLVVLSGAARATIKADDGPTEIRADEITCDRAAHRLVCKDNVRIETRAGTISGSMLTIDLAAKSTVYFLNGDGVTTGGTAGRATAPLQFEQKLPPVNTGLIPAPAR